MLAVSSIASATDVQTSWHLCDQQVCTEALEHCSRTKCEGKASCHNCITGFFPKCLTCYKEITKETPSYIVPFSCKSPSGVIEPFQKMSCQINCHAKSFKGNCFNEACICLQDNHPNPAKEEQLIEDHEDYVSSVAVLKDGSVASGSYDETIVVRNLEDGTYKTLNGHTHYVLSLAALQDGSLASGSRDETIKIWDLASGKVKRTLTGHAGRVCALAVLHNGQLASGSADNTIRIWDVKTGQQLRVLRNHTNFVCSLTVLDNGNLVSGSNDKTIRVWSSSNDFNPIGGPITVGGNVLSLATLVGDRFVSGTSDRKVILWSSDTLAQIKSVTLDSSQMLTSVQTTAKGNVAIGDADGYIRYWNLKGTSLSEKVAVHEYAIYSMALMRNGQLYTASGDHTTKTVNSPM